MNRAGRCCNEILENGDGAAFTGTAEGAAWTQRHREAAKVATLMTGDGYGRGFEIVRDCLLVEKTLWQTEYHQECHPSPLFLLIHHMVSSLVAPSRPNP